jgi:hypothetical protein
MRLLVLSVSALCAACFGATCALAQSGQWGQAEDQIPPYHTHVDRRHGHHHVYPDRGSIVRDAPQGAAVVNYAGISYRFADGVWYEPRGPAYIVVDPPIGLVVPQLPPFATSFDSGGKNYLYANDVFYTPSPDLGGYVVVNDPEDALSQESQAPAHASPPGTPGSAPIVTADATSQAVPASVPPTPSTSSMPASVRPTPSTSSIPASVRPTPSTSTILAPGPSTSAAAPTSAGASAPTVQANLAKSVITPPATPPAAPASVPSALANPTRVVINPHNGQSADQQASDRYECYRFAVAQSGFDPLALNSTAPAADAARLNSEYSRAQAACLEGRGYTIQ